MKAPQLITLGIAILLVITLYLFGKIVPPKKPSNNLTATTEKILSTDSILIQAKKQLSDEQITRLNSLEHSVVRGDVKEQQIKIYEQLARFWLDTGKIFEPFAWYKAEAARLENSEKSLTFAAHLFLENLREENNPEVRTWKALQAKDLFERSLKINPNNDSSIVGLGACYIFGNITDMPMEGIQKVLGVVNRDSSNIFGQEVLANGALMTGQYDKAISRFETVFRLAGNNSIIKLKAALLLADIYEKKSDKLSAATWYEMSLPLIPNETMREEVKKRIDDLKK